MSDLWLMDGNGPYVWAAWAITLAALIWNIWSARLRLKRNLRRAGNQQVREEPARRAKVSEI